MVLTDEERKAKKKLRQQTPKAKATRKTHSQTREAKEKQKEYNLRPRRKEKEKLRKQTPEYKKKNKEYHSRPDVKEKLKEYNSRPKRKEKQKEYKSRPDVKEKEKLYQQTPEYKKKQKVFRANQRLIILQYYSKRLSKSNIPCCNCCGENLHINFLAIDHIAGKKQMDSEIELVKIGYSSKLKNTSLRRWIIENNFPKGFQILCHNCNLGKEFSKVNQCPHEKT